MASHQDQALASGPSKVTVKRMTPEEFAEMERQADERWRNRPRPIDANGNIIHDERPVCRLPPGPRPVKVVHATLAKDDPNHGEAGAGPKPGPARISATEARQPE